MKKILIIRFSSIGDIVLTSPILRCIKTQLPDIELHVLTKKTNKLLYETSPYVDKVFSLSDNFNSIVDELKKENYDFVVDLHKNIRSLKVKFALGKPSLSFPKLNFYKYLAVRFKWSFLPKIHIVDRYFEAVKPLGVKNDFFGLDFFIPETESFNLDNIPENFRSNYVVFVIGGNHLTKILPSEKAIEIGKQLQQPIILLGGLEDKERGDEIAMQLTGKAWNTCGKLTLIQSAFLVKNAKAVLTNDTGLMHIAAAFKKPIVSVWGNTIPAFGMTPYMPGYENRSIMIENEALRCRPCSKIGFSKCPKKHFKCMMDLDTNKTIDALNEVQKSTLSY